MENNTPKDDTELYLPTLQHGQTKAAFKQLEFDSTKSVTNNSEQNVPSNFSGGFTIPDSTVYTMDNESPWLNAKLEPRDPKKHGDYLESNAEKLYREKVRYL